VTEAGLVVEVVALDLVVCILRFTCGPSGQYLGVDEAAKRAGEEMVRARGEAEVDAMDLPQPKTILTDL
jgi:hypothetical protein